MHFNKSSLRHAGLAVLLLFGLSAHAFAGDFYDPVGTHDRADCSKLAGWAKDGDTTLPIPVSIFKGGIFPFGTHIMYVTANLYRADLPFADKNHGFSINTPAAFKTGCPESVYIYGIDVDTNGNWAGNQNRLLNLTGKTVRCGFDPDCFDGPDGPPFNP